MRVLILTFALTSALTTLSSCRDEAPNQEAPSAVRAEATLGDMKRHVVASTPANAFASRPHLVIVTAREGAFEFALARCLAPELAASGEVASARSLPGPGEGPPQLTLIIDGWQLRGSEMRSQLTRTGTLRLRLVSADALGGLARRVRGRLPRPTFEAEISTALEGQAYAPSPQIARDALARKIAPALAEELKKILADQRKGLPFAEDPAPLRERSSWIEPAALPRPEITRLSVGRDATGTFEALYRIRGDEGRRAFVLNLVADLQKAKFRTLSRRKFDGGQTLAMRDDRHHVQLTVKSLDSEISPFQGFLVVTQSPPESLAAKRFDRIAGGEASVPALLALRRDLGPDRFKALAATLAERAQKLGLAPKALLALAEIERSEENLDRAQILFRQASHAAWLIGAGEADFPGTDLLARNLGLESESPFGSEAGSAPLVAAMTRSIPAEGEANFEVPAKEAAFFPLVLADARTAVLWLEPKTAGSTRFRLFSPGDDGRPVGRHAGDLSHKGKQTLTTNALIVSATGDGETLRLAIRQAP